MKAVRQVRSYWLATAIISSAFFLSGCGALSNVFAAHESQEPAPPFTQPQFPDFEPDSTVRTVDNPPQTAPQSAPQTAQQTTLQTAMPERLVIPAIELDTPVVELGWSASTSPDGRVFSRWDVAEYAAGWHKNSALLEDGGNVVMSGHNNVLGSVFRELDQLKQGDTALVMAGDSEYLYTIDSVIIVPDKTATPEQRRENAKWIADYPDDRLTLVSCWPRDDNTHRIIVVAHRTDGDVDSIKAGFAGQ